MSRSQAGTGLVSRNDGTSPALVVAALSGLAWGFLLLLSLVRSGSLHPGAERWGAADLLLAFAMWAVMMAGMMLPSVIPWVLALSRARGSTRAWPGFLLGYLTVWTAYAVLGAFFQGGIHEALLAGFPGAPARSFFGGSLLIMAGLYQWTSWKAACLDHCRSPIGFFLTGWKAGRAGHFRMGFQHGLFCVGCCWALMLLSLVLGVMNLFWMAFLTVFIFVDHSTRDGNWFGKGLGAFLCVWGSWLVLGGA